MIIQVSQTEFINSDHVMSFEILIAEENCYALKVYFSDGSVKRYMENPFILKGLRKLKSI